MSSQDPQLKDYVLINKNTLAVTLSNGRFETFYQFSNIKKPVKEWDIDDYVEMKSGFSKNNLREGKVLSVIDKEDNIISIGLPRDPLSIFEIDLDKIPSSSTFCGIC